MKKTSFVMLAMFLVAAVGGCSTDNSGTMQLTWTLTQGGAAANCALGDQVWVTSSAGGSTYVDKFNCSDKGGTVNLRPGSWSVLIELRDASNALVIPGATVTAVIASGQVTNIGLVTFDLGQTDGTVSATWQVTKNGVLTTCAAVTATTVKIRSTPVGSSTAIVDTFNCTDGGGTTDPLPAGTYNVKVDILNASGQSLNLVNVSGTVTVDAGANTPLGNFVFAF